MKKHVPTVIIMALIIIVLLIISVFYYLIFVREIIDPEPSWNPLEIDIYDNPFYNASDDGKIFFNKSEPMLILMHFGNESINWSNYHIYIKKTLVFNMEILSRNNVTINYLPITNKGDILYLGIEDKNANGFFKRGDNITCYITDSKGVKWTTRDNLINIE